MLRDERHGGYGDTSGLPSLAPGPERGAAAVAALTAVLEVHRETVSGGPADGAGTRDAGEEHRPPESPQPAGGEKAVAGPESAAAQTPVAAESEYDAATARAAERDAASPADLPEALGLADRLGLEDDDDEVGPTR